MKQLDQSFIIGIFGLIGLFIGLFVKNIMVWTFVGIAVGYVITFWIPYFLTRLHGLIRVQLC